ncbi:MAG: hypothetical protein HY286_17075 [Planctomycetes bacterium]|nr:hypothetical protein [Planctomycetota bacterium]
MNRIHTRFARSGIASLLTITAALFAFASFVRAQDSRTAMWFPPTAEDWKKPCLIHWQRSWEDAVALSKETGKPILVCVNMDGEIASEHYAGVRYRQPEIAKLYEPYICIITSVYRHTPRDYDENGRRVPCPRFGTVTCGEHINIEPGLFDQYFEGKRVAPRHILVEVDTKKGFDVFYAWDTDSVFKAIKDGVAGRSTNSIITVHGDQPIVERIKSRDAEDRNAVEEAYIRGDRDAKRAILNASILQRSAASPDLLRLAMRDLDVELNQLARRALAQLRSESAVELINNALRASMENGERDALIAALQSIGEKSPRARTLAAVHKGLAGSDATVDLQHWNKLIDEDKNLAELRDTWALESKMAEQYKVDSKRPEYAQSRLEYAEANLEFSIQQKTARKYWRLSFEDVQRAALEAENRGVKGWRVNGVLAVCAWYLGNMEEALKRAEAAMTEPVPADARGLTSYSVLTLFAQSRQLSIAKAVREHKEWPPKWMADVHATYNLLEKHPLGTDVNVLAHYDFLRQMGAGGQASQVLDAGLQHFPDSAFLHERLRARTLEEKGGDGLESVYNSMLQQKDARPSWVWFAGYATHMAAEFHKQAGRDAQALAAYDRAIAHYEHSIEANPATRESSDHFIALALSGKSRIYYERADYEQSVAHMLASFERRADSAATEDGLNRSPVSTAQMLLSKLKEVKRDDLYSKLDAALKNLDPVLLLPPSFENDQSGPPLPTSRPGRRGRGR